MSRAGNPTIRRPTWAKRVGVIPAKTRVGIDDAALFGHFQVIRLGPQLPCHLIVACMALVSSSCLLSFSLVSMQMGRDVGAWFMGILENRL